MIVRKSVSHSFTLPHQLCSFQYLGLSLSSFAVCQEPSLGLRMEGEQGMLPPPEFTENRTSGYNSVEGILIKTTHVDLGTSEWIPKPAWSAQESEWGCCLCWELCRSLPEKKSVPGRTSWITIWIHASQLQA